MGVVAVNQRAGADLIMQSRARYLVNSASLGSVTGNFSISSSSASNATKSSNELASAQDSLEDVTVTHKQASLTWARTETTA